MIGKSDCKQVTLVQVNKLSVLIYWKLCETIYLFGLGDRSTVLHRKTLGRDVHNSINKNIR